MAIPAGLEPATSDVTDQCSNQLNYGTIYGIVVVPTLALNNRLLAATYIGRSSYGFPIPLGILYTEQTFTAKILNFFYLLCLLFLLVSHKPHITDPHIS